MYQNGGPPDNGLPITIERASHGPPSHRFVVVCSPDHHTLLPNYRKFRPIRIELNLNLITVLPYLYKFNLIKVDFHNILIFGLNFKLICQFLKFRLRTVAKFQQLNPIKLQLNFDFEFTKNRVHRTWMIDAPCAGCVPEHCDFLELDGLTMSIQCSENTKS